MYINVYKKEEKEEESVHKTSNEPSQSKNVGMSHINHHGHLSSDENKWRREGIIRISNGRVLSSRR